MLELVKYPATILNLPANPVVWSVDSVTGFVEHTLHPLLDGMKEVMLKHKGIGLAAPQVGHQIQAFIMISQSRFKDQNSSIIEVINPKILESSEEYQQFNEGCLSAPNIYVEIQRPKEIFVEFQDRHGNIKQAVMTELEAVCFQHEYDHLQGIFYLSRTGRQQRNAALKMLSVK